MKKFILIMLFLSLGWTAEMNLDERISQEQKREQDNKTKIAILDGEIAALRQTLAEARVLTASMERSLYSKAGIRREEVEAQWAKIAEFIHKVDQLMLQPQDQLPSMEKNAKWAEQQWAQLKTLPVTKLLRSDTLSMLAEQGVLRLRAGIENLLRKHREDSLEALAIPAEPVATVEPPPPEPTPVVVEPVPPPPPPAPEPIPERSTFDGKIYRVGKASDRKDGTLWEIAAIVYGDPQKWQRLWRANKDQIKNPDRIIPGMVLIVPEGPVHKKKGD